MNGTVTEPRENHERHQMLDILLVEDDPDIRELLRDTLHASGHNVHAASDGVEGLDQVTRRVFDLILCDVRLPGLDGISLMRQARKEAPNTKVILMTAYAGVSEAVSALKEGAYDYLIKPFDVDELLIQTRRIGEEHALRRELHRARNELVGRGGETTLVGESPAIRRVVDMSKMVAQSDAPTLITGESGTGKEVVARLIHASSARAAKPFVAVNCGALAENLIEAELFGHERGAFTGAVKKRDGRFKAADGGVLFLDEIAELPASAQSKLLRVLQEGTFEPIGTNTSVRVDVRIVSATHRDLQERIKAGLFREDLFYRINVIEIHIPPLRDRLGDLPLLFRHFIQRHSGPAAALPVISPAAWAAMLHYGFPGNVREFSHAIERALILSGGKEIDLVHLPPSMVAAQVNARPSPPDAGLPTGNGPSNPTLGSTEPTQIRPLHVALREFEQEYLQRALKAGQGKRNRTAAMLGISRKTLWEKLRSIGIESGDAPEPEETPGEAAKRELDDALTGDHGDHAKRNGELS
jgi:two-component system response regulator AtoC